jgi:adenylylsulfate kinase
MISENNSCSKVVWLVGLSGAGKSTLGDALVKRLTAEGVQAVRLDGDDLREGLNSDLGFSNEDRTENLRRAAHVAKLYAGLGNVTIASFISPLEVDRQKIRAIIGEAFVEVYVKTSLKTCESRDPKGLYKRARAGEIKQFTGITSAFEPPAAPEVEIDTEFVGIDAAIELIKAAL